MTTTRGLLAALFILLCLIWSTTWAAIRLCEQGFSPLWAAELRFLLAAAVLTLLTWRGRGARPPLARWILPLAGLVNAVSYGLIYLAERQLTGGTAAVLGATNPFFVLAAAVALGYEQVSLRKALGLLVGFGGVCLLFGAGVSVGAAVALAMAQVLFAAAVLWPAYTVLMRRAGDAGWSAPQVTVSFVRWTTLFLALGALALEGRPHVVPTPSALGALLYLAFLGTAVAWSLFNYLLRRLPLTVLSTMLFIEPALALAIDHLLGDRAPGRAAVLGAGLILIGVGLSALGGASRERPRSLASAVPTEA